MNLRLITPPSIEPLTIADVENSLRIGDLSEEENKINMFITAARELAEITTRRALITQQWELTLDSFPKARNTIILPKGSLQTVDFIKYIDTDQVEQTLSPLAYRAISDREPCEVIPVYGLSWPDALKDLSTVSVRFTCGYGPLASDSGDPNRAALDNVPKSIKQWMLLQIGTLYENREAFVVGTRIVIAELTTLADGLISNYRLPRL